MSARPLVILAIVAAVLGAIVVLNNRPAERTNSADALFAPALAERLDEVETIRVVGPGDSTIARLTRTADDWIVEERDGYRANTGTIRSALTLLSRATVIEAKTTNPAEFARLGVESLTDSDAGGVGLEFLPESLALPGIILGDTAGTDYRYARLADSDQSWLINANPNVPDETTQWLDTEIMSVEGTRVERILVEHADGETLEIFKSEPEQSNYSVANIPEGRSLQYPGVANVIGNVLRDLRLEDVAVAEDEPATPEMTTRFETFDGLVVTARGFDIDGTGWLVFSAGVDTEYSNPDESVTSEAQTLEQRLSGWRYRIPDYKYSQIGRRIEDLLSAEDSSD